MLKWGQKDHEDLRFKQSLDGKRNCSHETPFNGFVKTMTTTNTILQIGCIIITESGMGKRLKRHERGRGDGAVEGSRIVRDGGVRGGAGHGKVTECKGTNTTPVKMCTHTVFMKTVHPKAVNKITV